jgi:hypothetical protein
MASRNDSQELHKLSGRVNRNGAPPSPSDDTVMWTTVTLNGHLANGGLQSQSFQINFLSRALHAIASRFRGIAFTGKHLAAILCGISLASTALPIKLKMDLCN